MHAFVRILLWNKQKAKQKIGKLNIKNPKNKTIINIIIIIIVIIIIIILITLYQIQYDKYAIFTIYTIHNLLYCILHMVILQASIFFKNQLCGNINDHRRIIKTKLRLIQKNDFGVGLCKRRKVSMSWRVLGIL